MSPALSRKYATPLHLDISASRLLGYWVILVHAVPLLLLPVLQLAGWLSPVIAAVVLVSLIRSWRLQVLRQHPDAICSLVWGEGKRCLLDFYSGRQQETDLCTQAFILPWLVILRFKRRRRLKRYLVLLPDMLDYDVFRRLCVRLQLEINRP
jgi:hypothetical protein